MSVISFLPFFLPDNSLFSSGLLISSLKTSVFCNGLVVRCLPLEQERDQTPVSLAESYQCLENWYPGCFSLDKMIAYNKCHPPPFFFSL